MKTILRVTAAIPLFISPLAMAGENVPDRYGYIGGHASYYTFYENEVYRKDVDGLDNVPFYGGQIGWRFHPNWSVQGWYEDVEGDAESKYDSGRRVDMSNYFASARYHFNDHGIFGFEPYAGLNAGEQTIERVFKNDTGDKHDETMTGVELGVQRAFFKHVILDVGTRQAYSLDREYWEGQVYAGLNLAFGISNDSDDTAEEEVVPATPAEVVTGDSDGDGVTDDRDRCPNTASGAVVDADGCQVYETLEQRQTSVIYFGFDRDTIQGQFTDEIRGVAERLNGGEQGRIRVEGHADSTGPADYNQGLSERRAQSVKDRLMKDYKVSGDRISTEGFGEDRPVADNSTREGRAKNRRAEIIVETEEKKAQFK
ncbi:MAG: OmpA family protein [Alcanivorax sp.]|uniref:OmpA family protein n=1 Tax=Alcanivorax sp. TaxID=1872427 RepID=UPI002609148C|nr:OmpA family protein [Alcanivorax sp.]MDF1723248.1 OmpA family protein [Alcanivorax sp.]